jgi:hypothetical protein
MSPAQSGAGGGWEGRQHCSWEVRQQCSRQARAACPALPSSQPLAAISSDPRPSPPLPTPLHTDAFVMFQQRREEYKRRVKQEAAKYPPPV